MAHFQPRLLGTLVLGSVLASPLVQAELLYDSEFTVSYEYAEEDPTTIKTQTYVYEHYLTPVEVGDSPFALAAFLDRASSITAGYIISKTGYEDSSERSRKLEGPGVGVNYISIRDRYILGATWAKLDSEVLLDRPSTDGTEYSLKVGKYVNDNTRVQLSLTECEINYFTPSPLSSSRLEITTHTLDFFTVKKSGLSNHYSFGLNLEHERATYESNKKVETNTLDLQFGYYFGQTTSVGLGYSLASGDDVSQEGDTLAASITHFIMPDFGYTLAFGKFSADDESQSDIDSASLALFLRM